MLRGLIGKQCGPRSGTTLFACMLKFASNVRQLFAADDFSRRHLQMHFSWRFKGKFHVNVTQLLFMFQEADVELEAAGLDSHDDIPQKQPVAYRK